MNESPTELHVNPGYEDDDKPTLMQFVEMKAFRIHTGDTLAIPTVITAIWTTHEILRKLNLFKDQIASYWPWSSSRA